MTLDEWKSEINASPDDILNRERFADWLEERGEPSEGWRRLNRFGKVPSNSGGEWHWFFEIRFFEMGDRIAIGKVCQRIGWEAGDGSRWKRFSTAFDALAAAAHVMDTTDAILPEEEVDQ